MSTHIRLPDLLAGWPFKLVLNPYHQKARQESLQWIESYHVFDPEAKASFNRCNAGLFAAMAYPHADPSHFRVICDLFNFFFVLEYFSDNADAPTVRSQAFIIQDALKDPYKPPPHGECVLGVMMKKLAKFTFDTPDEPIFTLFLSLWSRALEFTSESSASRFVKNFSEHTDSLVEEAKDRDQRRVRGIDDYLELRRGTVAARPCFDFFLLPENLPDRAISHPAVERLILGAMDMMILANDVYSYNKEQACGEDAHNMVSAVMHEKGLDIQGAMDYIGEQYRKISTTFLEDVKRIPSFPEPIDKVVQEYVFGLGNWATAIIEWSFATERYFGKKGQEIKEQLVFELRPKTLGCKISAA